MEGYQSRACFSPDPYLALFTFGISLHGLCLLTRNRVYENGRRGPNLSLINWYRPKPPRARLISFRVRVWPHMDPGVQIQISNCWFLVPTYFEDSRYGSHGNSWEGEIYSTILGSRVSADGIFHILTTNWR